MATEKTSRWSPGDEIYWSYANPMFPEVVDLRPVRVIADDARHLAMWLAPGTRFLCPALSDGQDLRSAQGPQMFTASRVQGSRHWSGNGIVVVLLPGSAYSVWFFESETGLRDSYYLNIEKPFIRTETGVESEDLVLDVLANRKRETRLKDEDELEYARQAGHLTYAEIAKIRAAAARAIGDLEQWKFPFGAGYESFQPEADWGIVPLPAGASWTVER